MEKEFLISLGERIRKRRLELGYTQEVVAELIDASNQMVSDTEWGKKGLRLENFIRLCSVLETTPDYLITGREPSEALFEGMDKLTDEQYERVSKIIKEAIALCLDENEH